MKKKIEVELIIIKKKLQFHTFLLNLTKWVNLETF